MRMLIQILLIAVVVLVVARIFRSRGARAQAIRPSTTTATDTPGARHSSRAPSTISATSA